MLSVPSFFTKTETRRGERAKFSQMIDYMASATFAHTQLIESRQSCILGVTEIDTLSTKIITSLFKVMTKNIMVFGKYANRLTENHEV